MNGSFYPLAAGIDLGVLMFIVLLIISAIGSLINKIHEAQEAARRRQQRRAPPRPVQAGGRPAEPSLEDEIREFLRGRRAAGGKAARPAGRPARPAPVPPAQPARVPAGRKPAAPAPPARPARQLRPAQPPREEVPVAKPVEPPRPQRPETHLGHLEPTVKPSVKPSVPEEESQFEERLHKVFDHKISQLESMSGEAAQAVEVQEPEWPEDRIAAPPLTSAAGLAALLADTRNLSQAILIHEILTRPEQRWNW